MATSPRANVVAPILKVLFTTSGFGGNEIAAIRVLRALVDGGALLSVSADHAVPRLQSALQAAGLALEPLPPGIAPDILVSPSFLQAARCTVTRFVRKGTVYVYTPFWGHEWVKRSWSRLFRQTLCRALLSRWCPVHLQLLAPYRHMLTAVPNAAQEAWVLPNIVQSGAYRSGGLPVGEGVDLYCIGRIDFRQKGQDRLLRVVRDQVFPKYGSASRLTFIGDGPDLAALVSLAGEDSRVSFTGWQDPPLTLRKGGIIVMPSAFEGLPLVGMEALLSGFPVVATPESGLRDFLPDALHFDLLREGSLSAALDNARQFDKERCREVSILILRQHSEESLSEAANAFLRGVTRQSGVGNSAGRG